MEEIAFDELNFDDEFVNMKIKIMMTKQKNDYSINLLNFRLIINNTCQ